MRRPFSLAGGLECVACGHTADLQPIVTGCPRCGGQLEVTYDLSRPERIAVPPWSGDAGRRQDGGPGRMWRYHQLLPVPAPRHVVSLAEGATPLLPLVGTAGDGPGVWAKVETRNPTGSFKDRYNAVVVSMAKAFGLSRLTCLSTGNHAVSLAAYAARAGMAALVYCDRSAPDLALAEARRYGATARLADGANGLQLLADLWQTGRWFPSIRNFPRPPERPVANPFGIEGYKTIAYEIVDDLDGRPPDAVFVPVGGGDGIAGLWRGFRDLRHLGILPRLPRLYACQAAASASLVAAFEGGAPAVAPITPGGSIAISIVDRQTGDHALRAVSDSGGTALALAEGELKQALGLAAANGLCLDPASGASIAGYLQARRTGRLPPTATAVCLVTGHGYRWPHAFPPSPAGEPAGE